MGLFLTATPAQAATPWWHLTQRSITTNLKPGGEGVIVVEAFNLGDAPASGPVTLSDALPPGLTLQGVEFYAPNTNLPGVNGHPSADLGPSGILPGFGLELCQLTSTSVSCSLNKEFEEFLGGAFYAGPIVPYERVEMRLHVGVAPGAVSGGIDAFTTVGGGAAPVTSRRPIVASEETVGFGAEDFRLTPEAEGGAVATRAGSHPFQLTTDVSFNRSSADGTKPPALPRNLSFNLPAGQLGNPTVTPTCSDAQFSTYLIGATANQCAPETVIGATAVTVNVSGGAEEITLAVPVFNLTPAPGEPARFGFEVLETPVVLGTAIRSGNGGDYGVTVDATNITQVAGFLSAVTTFWGAPAAAAHDESRGWGCLRGGYYKRLAEENGQPGLGCTPSTQAKPAAFLTLPTDCAAPFDPSLEGTSWPTTADPAGLSFGPISSPLENEAGAPLGLTGCNQVPFDPRIEAEPTSDAATSPTGLNFDIDFQDEGLVQNSEGVAQSQMKRAVVTLPEGFTTNPSVAEGLHSCSQGQYESENFESTPGTGCPENSKIGDVEIESPLVTQKVLGSLYVAKQGENPNDNNLLTIYLVAKNPEIGVLIRQALRVTPNPLTGQLTTEVDNVPELPFSHFELSFRQGQRSPLITPPTCGTYTIGAELYPWSDPGAPVHRESSFQITQGPEGNPCPNGIPPFHPVLEAGTLNNAAGTYSPFVTHITRKDSEQEITHFSIKLPPGLSGRLVGVTQCGDSQIAAAKAREHELGGQEEIDHPSCPASSEVGHTLVGTGVGNVLAYAPGKLYLAGPYKGSNLSIVSITAAKVGPFDLGTVVIRQALKVDPVTAQVSVDAAGSDPIPHIVDGIPVHLRDIRIYVDRPNFTINPTSCTKMSTAATVLGSGLNFASEADDQPVTVTSPFQAADCASLGFKPQLALQLKGQTRRGGLPKLVATVTYPKNGAYANIASTIVSLPHSELLEQGHIGTSCTRVQFNEGGGNGEHCPAASIYGHAKALTPLLEEPVEGPVYLRSNGGERQLPDLVAALHSKDINVDLVGFIDSVHKKGSENSSIRTRFLSVPDAPVSKFTLEMSGGKKGLLINSTNLCKGTHRAKSQFVGQNGKLLETEPKVQAQCGKQSGKKKSGH